MTRHFTDEENRQWQKTLPTKIISSLCLFIDDGDRLLMVKPSYKPEWSLVGGIVDANESPIDAMIRETTEEIGLTVPQDRFRLLGTKYTAPKNDFLDSIHFTFTARLETAEIANIVLQDSELEEMCWVDETGARALGMRDSIAAGFDALREGSGYIEGPEVVVPGYVPDEFDPKSGQTA